MPLLPQRFEFYPPGSTEPVTSLWAKVTESPEGPTIFLDLLHDYPDFHPAPGWMVSRRGKFFRILSASGRLLSCVPTVPHIDSEEVV